MKRIRVEKWACQFLPPRPLARSACLPRPHLRQQQPPCLQPCNRRWQSATTASASSTQHSEAAVLSALHTTQQPSSSPAGTSPRRTSAKLAALHARLSLPSRLPVQTLARTLVHPSADSNPDFNNASLAVIGSDLLGYYTSEHLLCHYPRLPMSVLFAAQWAYVGPSALAAMAREWGVEEAAAPGPEVDPGLLQYKRVDHTSISQVSLQGTGRPNELQPWRRGITSRVVYDDQFGELKSGGKEAPQAGDRPDQAVTAHDASKSFVRALVGAIYLHGGRAAAKRFFEQHFLSRQLNMASLFDFKQPTRDLSRLCAREGFEPPVARLISETGRLSRHPVFVVGVYSGKDKLGEGVGASLDEARIRAAAAALKSWYLYSPLDVTVPSSVEGAAQGEARWIPNHVDCGEVIV